VSQRDILSISKAMRKDHPKGKLSVSLMEDTQKHEQGGEKFLSSVTFSLNQKGSITK
jgi:hypothetical protein